MTKFDVLRFCRRAKKEMEDAAEAADEIKSYCAARPQSRALSSARRDFFRRRREQKVASAESYHSHKMQVYHLFRTAAIDIIADLTNTDQREVLIQRYILDRKISEIARSMYACERNIYRLHLDAVTTLATQTAVFDIKNCMDR